VWGKEADDRWWRRGIILLGCVAPEKMEAELGMRWGAEGSGVLETER
jgi:hypothetical protein